MRPVMGSEYDVPYVHGLIDEIERLRGIEEQLEAYREALEEIAGEKDEPLASAAWYCARAIETLDSSPATSSEADGRRLASDLPDASDPASMADQSPSGEESVNQGGASLSPGPAPPASSPASEPGWISPVQKVVELQEQLEALCESYHALHRQWNDLHRELELWSVGIGPSPERMKELRDMHREVSTPASSRQDSPSTTKGGK